MLDFDDYAAYLAHREIEHVFHDRCVFAAPSHITNQNRQSAANFQCLITALQTDHQEFSECFVALTTTQIIWIVATVSDDVPIWRMYPHKVKPARQVLLG